MYLVSPFWVRPCFRLVVFMESIDAVCCDQVSVSGIYSHAKGHSFSYHISIPLFNCKTMSMRPPSNTNNSRGGSDRSGGVSGSSGSHNRGGKDKGSNINNNLEDPLLDTENDNLSDDDNAQIDDIDDEAKGEHHEDPLLLAIDDLEGRVVAAMDDVKLHPGIKTTASSSSSNSVHDELASLLRPVLEVAAHTGPSVARTYYRGAGPEGIEASVEDVYERTVSDLTLPVMLEIAQSDTNPAKRGASLEFFRTYYKECHKAGSWLDATTVAMAAGPYGPGGSHHSTSGTTPAMRVVIKRRQQKRLLREGEILRYWVEAAVACLVTGVLTDADAEGAVASRGIIAASAALRPSLQHIAQRIRDADDRGATRLYGPVMKMVDGVLRKLFLGSHDAVRSASIKFLEILMLCCSHKPPDDSSRRKGQGVSGDTYTYIYMYIYIVITLTLASKLTICFLLDAGRFFLG